MPFYERRRINKCDLQTLLFCCVNLFFLVNAMNTHQRYMQYRKNELYHYNENHDPKDGKFTSGPKGVVSKVKSALRKLDGQDYLDELKSRKGAESKAIKPSTHEEELALLEELDRMNETAKHQNVDFGNNKTCPIVLQNGISEKRVNEILSDRSLDAKFREYAFNRALTEVKKDSLLAQQITFLGRMEETGLGIDDDPKADVIAWYGETPDGAGEMMYYNTELKKIVGSEFYR